MKTKFKNFAIVLGALLVPLFVILLGVKYVSESTAAPHPIFISIDECYNIERIAGDSATITYLEAPQGDEYIEQIPYAQFCGIEYTSDEFDFVLYAYHFNSIQDAQAYFSNHCPNKTSPMQNAYFGSGGIGFSFTAIGTDCAYTFYSKTRDEAEVRTFLSTVFTTSIEESMPSEF